MYNYDLRKRLSNYHVLVVKTLHRKWNIPFCRTSFFIKYRMSLGTLRSTSHALHGERKILKKWREQPCLLLSRQLDLALLGQRSTSQWSYRRSRSKGTSNLNVQRLRISIGNLSTCTHTFPGRIHVLDLKCCPLE